MMDKREYPPPLPPIKTAKIESFGSIEPLPTSRKKKNKNKRRFSDEQVKLMESMFETETKLEPKKKMQLARELGLQPRQVAIWFQNRRARWRSKHIEKEYAILKADYDNLTSRYECLKKEKQSLLLQFQKLSDLLEQPHDMSKGRENLVGNSTDGSSDNGDNNNCEHKTNPCCLEEGLDNIYFMGLDENKSRNIGNPCLEEGQELLHRCEQVDGSSTSPEKWCRVDPCALLDQSYNDLHWWDF